MDEEEGYLTMKLEEVQTLFFEKIKACQKAKYTGQVRLTLEVNMSQGGIGGVETNVEKAFINTKERHT